MEQPSFLRNCSMSFLHGLRSTNIKVVIHMLKMSDVLYAKSLERSPAVGDFYGTGIEIWAGFGLNG